MSDKIHEWFELSYAQYLTVPRSVLQSMPDKWQSKFVSLLEELDETIDWRPVDGTYKVSLNNIVENYSENEERFIEEWGPDISDPLQDYQRGRRKVKYIDK